MYAAAAVTYCLSLLAEEVAHRPSVQPRESSQFDDVEAALAALCLGNEGLRPPETLCHFDLSKARILSRLTKPPQEVLLVS